MTVLPTSSELASTLTVLSISALFVHQIFRKYETFNLPFHAFLLLAPPVIAVYLLRPAGMRWLTLSDLAFYYTWYLGALATSVILYRLSPFHPLHRYPGPILCRTSMIWHAIKTHSGKQMEYLRSLHDSYGDIVRVGPNHLSIRDVSLIGPILGVSGLPKAATYKGSTLSETNVPMIGIQDPEEHTRRRRAWNRGLAPSALKGFDHIMFRRVHQLVDVLGQQEGVVVLGKWINYFAYDFMSDMAFGGGSEQMHAGDVDDIWGLVEKGMEIAFHLGQLPWLGIYLGYIPGASGPVNIVLEHSRRLTKKRIAQGSLSRDLFYYLNNEDLPKEDSERPLERHVLDDGVLAMIAGSDTVSSAITSIFHCLLAHPDAYTALQDEVDRFYPQGEDVCDTAHHRDMHYLTAVINETLRLFPPAPTSTSRQVPRTAAAPVVLGSIVLTPGTHVYVPPYVLHRDARNFVCPDAFWPERWFVASGHFALSRARPPLHPGLPSSTPGSSSPSPSTTTAPAETEFVFAHNDGAFIPFSHGPMNCAGKALAMRQMRVVVCALLRRFHLRAVEGWDKGRYEREFRDFLVANRPEVRVVLEPRW